MKTVLLCALMALVPFSTIRVVCVTTHEIDAAASAAAAEAEALECARFCAHRPAADTPAPAPAPAPKMKCLITVDPGCELLAMQVFLMPQPPVMPTADGLVAIHATAVGPAAVGEHCPPGPPPKRLA